MSIKILSYGVESYLSCIIECQPRRMVASFSNIKVLERRVQEAFSDELRQLGFSVDLSYNSGSRSLDVNFLGVPAVENVTINWRLEE